MDEDFEAPTVLTTDKAPALLYAFNNLTEQGFYNHTIYCTIKNWSNLTKQGQKHVRGRFTRSTGCQSLLHASRTLKCIKTIYALYK
nr:MULTISPECIES: hypothetical protein [Bacillus cereus group]